MNSRTVSQDCTRQNQVSKLPSNLGVKTRTPKRARVVAMEDDDVLTGVLRQNYISLQTSYRSLNKVCRNIINMGMNNVSAATGHSSGSQIAQFDRNERTVILNRIQSSPTQYEIWGINSWKNWHRLSKTKRTPSRSWAECMTTLLEQRLKAKSPLKYISTCCNYILDHRSSSTLASSKTSVKRITLSNSGGHWWN
ncbi:unnamed protein product [Absidia cylindrospora]